MIDIRCENPSPRLDYSASFIFGRVLGVAHRFVGFREAAGTKSLTYDVVGNSNLPCVPMSGEIDRIAPGRVWDSPQEVDGMPVIYRSSAKEGYPFDIFAAVFFCLSRAEEYAHPGRDAHGRFCAQYSIFYPWLRQPYVDEWIWHFAAWLHAKGVIDEMPKIECKWINTIDIDVAYAYKGRGFLRQLGAVFRDVVKGDGDRLKERMAVLRGQQSDPFDTYELVESVKEKAHSNLFFVLSAKRKGLDINLNPASRTMKRLVRYLDQWAEVGIHPSYASLNIPTLVRDELTKLENSLGHPIALSRQHFLRFELPSTFRNLYLCGIQQEFSLGFADDVGFRSGTSHPYFFFDLLANEVVHLEIVPLIAMDSALKNHLKLNVDQAFMELEALWDKVQRTGGSMVTVWHNHSLSDRGEWAGWQKVYTRFAAAVDRSPNSCTLATSETR